MYGIKLFMGSSPPLRIVRRAITCGYWTFVTPDARGCSEVTTNDTESLRWLILARGEIYSEHAPHAGKISHTQLTAVRFDAPTTYGESEPQTCSLRA